MVANQDTRRIVGIEDMQCWVFCNAMDRLHLTGSECASVFEKHRIMNYIEDCYDILHVSGYDAILTGIEEIVRKDGETDGMSAG